MKRTFLLVLVLFAGCGGSGSDGLCDRYSGLELGNRIGACDLTLRGLPTQTACADAMPSCNSDDKKQLDTLLGCLGPVSTCQKGEEDSWAAQVNGCFDRLDLSTSCANALQ